MANRLHAGSKGAAAAVILTLLATTAGHALSPEEVWGAWQSQYAGYGYDIAAGQDTRAGDTLVLRDVTMHNAAEGATVDLKIPEVRLRDLGDGRVEATFSPEATGRSSSPGPDGAEVAMDLWLRQTGTVALVSGTVENLNYHLTSPEVTVEITEAPALIPPPATEGAPAQIVPQRQPVAMRMAATGIEGDYVFSGGTQQKQDSKVTVKAVRLSASGADTESDATFTLTGDLADVALSSVTELPRDSTVADLGNSLRNGMMLEAHGTYGANGLFLETLSQDGPMTVKTDAAGGSFDMSLGSGGMRYAGTSTDATIAFSSQQAPLPLSAALKQVGFEFAGPIAKSDVPGPFSGKISLVGLTLSDTLWGIFDPQARLPRDPATVVLDIGGTARPLADLFDPAQVQGDRLPVEVDTLDLNRLQVSAAGAELTGSGGVTVDNAQGKPVPSGAVDLSLSGANGLMDNLIAMGLVPQDQMMFVRMLLGLYAVAAGDDRYTSKIEFGPDGEILANGQRIR